MNPPLDPLDAFNADNPTGRNSSITPNLQNIPFRTPEAARIRAAFTGRELCSRCGVRKPECKRPDCPWLLERTRR